MTCQLEEMDDRRNKDSDQRIRTNDRQACSFNFYKGKKQYFLLIENGGGGGGGGGEGTEGWRVASSCSVSASQFGNTLISDPMSIGTDEKQRL